MVLGVLSYELCWFFFQVAVILFGAKLLCAGVLFVAVISSVCHIIRCGGVDGFVRLNFGILVVGVGCCAMPISLFLFCLSGYPFVCFSFRCTRRS